MNAIHLDVADYILELLMGQAIAPGERLPSDQELARKFHTTRINIKRTYERLEDMGYVVELPQKGYTPIARQYVSLDLEQTTTKLLVSGWHHYQRALWKTLDLHELHRVQWEVTQYAIRDTAIALRYVYAGDRQLDLERHQYPRPIGLALKPWLKGMGYSVVRMGSEHWGATYATKEERGWLDASSLEPILVKEQAIYDESGQRLLLYCRYLFRASTRQYVVYSQEGADDETRNQPDNGAFKSPQINSQV